MEMKMDDKGIMSYLPLQSYVASRWECRNFFTYQCGEWSVHPMLDVEAS